MQSNEHALLGAGSNVVVMNRHRTDARFRHIPMVEGYWQALRGQRAMPRRAEVDPRGIEDALEYAFILEQIAPGIGRLRIAGSHLSDLLGMEVRGMPLSAFFRAEARDDLAALLARVCATPGMASLSLRAEPGISKPVLEARMILLPLRDEAGAVNRILGCFDSHGSIGRAPRHLTITSHRLIRITGYDMAQHWPHQRISTQDSISPAAFCESHVDFADTNPTARHQPGVPHLRLVSPQD